MDVNTNVDTLPKVSLLFLTFLRQTPLQNQALEVELNQLSRDVSRGADPRLNTCGIEHTDHRGADPGIECDGELESDGHCPSNARAFLQDLLPEVHFQEDAEAIQDIAAELIRIADDLNHSIMSDTAAGLAKQLTSTSSLQRWQELVRQSVNRLLTDMPGTHNEQVAIALTFSLVKAVCEQVPPLLRGLYRVLMQWFSQTTPR